MRKFLLFVISYLLFAPSVYASDFAIDHHLSYVLEANGFAKVNHRVDIKNTSSTFAPQALTINIGAGQLDGLSVYSANHPLPFKQVADRLDIEIDNPNLGLNKITPIVISYHQKVLDQKGLVWEMTIPKNATTKIGSYTVEVVTNTNYPNVAYSDPEVTRVGNKLLLNSSKLALKGGLIALGNFQSYAFALQFDLPKANQAGKRLKIPIFADSNYQKVIYTYMQPVPQFIERDLDGNWLAEYTQASTNNLPVTLTGHIIVSQVPLSESTPPEPEHLASTNLWNFTNSNFTKLTWAKNPKEIYDQVVQYVDYRIDHPLVRKGVAILLANQPFTGVCTEFADLLITAFRAKGHPARMLIGPVWNPETKLPQGFAEGQTLHAWVEYWKQDKLSWLNVDPTWEKTNFLGNYFDQFDFNHVVLVKRGLNDSTPSLNYLTNVTLQPVNYTNLVREPITVKWQKPWQIFPFTNSLLLEVTNSTGEAITNKTIEINGKPTKLKFIPPFQSIHISFPFKAYASTFVVEIDNQKLTYNVPSYLYVGTYLIIPGILTFGLVAWFAKQTRGLHL